MAHVDSLSHHVTRRGQSAKDGLQIQRRATTVLKTKQSWTVQKVSSSKLRTRSQLNFEVTCKMLCGATVMAGSLPTTWEAVIITKGT
jgi:hypothetical protein